LPKTKARSVPYTVGDNFEKLSKPFLIYLQRPTPYGH